jgi:phosphatidylglycerol:prolipoprotein diacylglycerol transferase
MPYPHLDPVFLRLGPLEFRWYGLMYILAFGAAYLIIAAGVRRRGLPLDREGVADLVFTVAVGIILGGRLGYVLFYHLSYYLAHPLKLFAVWEGGMSFHGGLIGALTAGALFVRKRRLDFWQMADVGFLAGPVGLGLGRLGNFINGELYGRVTDHPWGMVFPGGGELPRHPSQLYEAVLEGPVLFLVLWWLGRRQRPAGVVLGAFVAGYGIIRFGVEFVREPDSQLGLLAGGLSMGQLLSLPMALVGGGLIWWSYRRDGGGTPR